MNAGEQTIHNLYSAFQKKDYRTMQQCYTDNATFSDPVFENLSAREVRAMWEMFCVKSKDITIEFDNITANDTTGSATWKATYTFSKTGHKVINLINAKFRFVDDKIIQHNDDFNFYSWARQALGLKGFLLGWAPFVKHKVQASAVKSLHNFMGN